jgi:Protein of unknown function (DUF551).
MNEETKEAMIERISRAVNASFEKDHYLTHGEICLIYDEISTHAILAQWISVKDRLPEYAVEIIFYTVKQKVSMGSRQHFYDSEPDNYYWQSDGWSIRKDDVTYWQPLPLPPKAKV